MKRMAKPLLGYLTTADRVIRDSVTSKSTYVDIFTKIGIPATTDHIVTNFFIAGRMHNLPIGPLECDVEILKPDNTLLINAHLTGSVQTAEPTDLTAEFRDVTLSIPGKYTYQVRYGDQVYKNPEAYYFEVKKNGAQ